MSQEQSNINSQESQTTAGEAVKPKKRFCWVGLAAVFCLICSFLWAVVPEMDTYKRAPVAYGLLILTPFLAIISLIRIGRKGDKLKGSFIAVLILIVSCFAINELSYPRVPYAREFFRPCGTNIRGLGTALEVYAHDNNDTLPDKDWCDRLVEEADVSFRSLQCGKTHSVQGESDFCMNQYAAGRKLSELPPDMVLLFEMEIKHGNKEVRLPIKQRPSFTKDSVTSEMFKGDEKVYLNQWNQVGGPEMLVVSRHTEGSCVVFADTQSKFIERSEFPRLRWDIEGKVFYNPQAVSNLKERFIISHKTALLTAIGIIWSVCSIYILVRFHMVRYWKFALFLGILAAGAGYFFGNMSGEAYIELRQAGKIPGLVTGLLAGVCFAVIFAGRSDELKRSVTFKWFMLGVGMITGILCSMFVHIALMIVNEETNPFGIIIGIPYGIFVGGVLGLVSYFVIRKFYVR
jgi:hypothetical protein